MIPLREHIIVDPQVSSQVELKLQLTRVEKTVLGLQKTLLEYEEQVRQRAKGPAADTVELPKPQSSELLLEDHGDHGGAFNAINSQIRIAI